MKETKKYKVCVKCYTFNQKSYIEDAMRGFVMQKTDFPFVAVIVDDASMDGEQDFIQSFLRLEFYIEDVVDAPYGTIYKAHHKENSNCWFTVILLKENHYSRKKSKLPYVQEWIEQSQYMASCEGDDYWTEPTKLQKQATFLDQNTNYSMCFHAVRNLYPNGVAEEVHRYNSNMMGCPIEDMIESGGGYAKINAMMYRIESYTNGYEEWTGKCPVGDLPMQLTLFAKGKVGYIDEVMSCYRISANGSWSERMRGSIKKISDHHRQIEKMWKDYDAWTSRKYHKSIIRKIMRNRVILLKTEIDIEINKIIKK